MADVFVSYAREDAVRVRSLVRLLESRGLSVFWDLQIPAGKTWREHIGQALAQAPCVLVVWSTHSIASSFVAEEADEGRQRGVLVPVLIDAVLPPLGLRSLQSADLQDLGASALPRGFDQLLSAIQSLLAHPPQSFASAVEAKPAATAAPAAAATKAKASGARPTALLIGVVALLFGGAGAYHFVSGRTAPSSTSAAPTTTEVQWPSNPQADGTRVSVLDRWATPGGGLAIRVQVTQRGDVPLAVSASSAFALLRPGAAAEAPVESRPLFETLQRDDPVVFELRFISADGNALRISLGSQPPQVIDVPAAR